MRFRFIEDRRSDYPATVMCDVLGISPAGYHAWRARPESQRAVANCDLVDDIKWVHRDTNGRSSSPRVHAELRAQGRGENRGRIQQLTRRHDIRAIMARPRRARTTDSHQDEDRKRVETELNDRRGPLRGRSKLHAVAARSRRLFRSIGIRRNQTSSDLLGR
jgi:hypothetical protein